MKSFNYNVVISYKKWMLKKGKKNKKKEKNWTIFKNKLNKKNSDFWLIEKDNKNKPFRKNLFKKNNK